MSPVSVFLVASGRLKGDQCVFNSEIRKCIIREKNVIKKLSKHNCLKQNKRKEKDKLKKFNLITFSQRGLDFVILNVV